MAESSPSELGPLGTKLQKLLLIRIRVVDEPLTHVRLNADTLRWLQKELLDHLSVEKCPSVPFSIVGWNFGTGHIVFIPDARLPTGHFVIF